MRGVDGNKRDPKKPSSTLSPTNREAMRLVAGAKGKNDGP